jgi:type I restriction enzyme S subunit
MSGHQLVDSMRDRPRRVRSSTITPVSLGPDFTRAMEGHVLFPPFETVGDIATAIRCGDPIRGDQRQEGPYPYLGASGQIDSHHEFNFDGRYLIVSQDGSIGNAWVQTGRFWANNHVWIVSIRPSIDIHAAATYLNCVYPYWRGMTTGSVVPKVTAEALSLVPVVTACWASDAQRYIGDKVRLAERLRERARSLRRELEDQLSIAALVAALSTNDQRANRVSTSDLSPRLDSKYYGSRSMAVLHAAATNSVSIGSLVEEVSNGFEHRDFAADGTPYITVTEVSGGRLVLGTAPRLGAEVSIPKKAQLDTCCALVVRTGSIGVAVPVFQEDTHAAISSHLIRLRFKTEEEAAVVAAFLNSEAGRVLQRKISYGAVQPQIGQDELLALPVPKTLLDSAESILELLTTEDAALRAAQRLTTSATLLVESLIEGKLTEADLSAAQKALESGDRGLDRAILQAFRQNGNPAQPLIADLDGLYALLDELDQETNA